MVKFLKSQLNFALLWSVLVLISAIAGFSITGLLNRNLDDRDYTIRLLLTLLLIGLLIGLGQWLAIRSKIKNGLTWIAATAIGFSVGSFLSFFIVGMVAQSLLGPENRHAGTYQWVEAMTANMMTGIFTGGLQWLTLRRKSTTTLRWLLLSGVSLVAGYMVNVFAVDLFSINDLEFSIRFGIIGGFVFTFSTCAFAELLIPHSKLANDEVLH